MTTAGHTLRDTFGPSESDVQRAIRDCPELLAEILKFVGVRERTHFDTVSLEFGGQPDMVCVTDSNRRVVVEVCFELVLAHIHKDLIYLIDPKLDGQIAALVWVCDSLSAGAEKMITYYAARLALHDTVALVVLTPEHLYADAPGECRFRREVAIEPPPRGLEFADTDVRDALRRRATRGEVDGPSIAAVLGMSRAWVSSRAGRKLSSGRPPLLPKRDSADVNLRGPDGRFRYDLGTVLEFIDHAEAWVSRTEGLEKMIPLASAEAAKGDLVSASEIRSWPEAPRNTATVKKRAGPPKAFCFSVAARGYSLLFSREFALSLRG